MTAGYTQSHKREESNTITCQCSCSANNKNMSSSLCTRSAASLHYYSVVADASSGLIFMLIAFLQYTL